MAKYRKKPVVIEAWLWHGDPTRDSLLSELRLAAGVEPAGEWGSDKRLVIPTLEGRMIAEVGDWIIRGVKGEFYPVKPDIFAQTYEAVDDAAR